MKTVIALICVLSLIMALAIMRLNHLDAECEKAGGVRLYSDHVCVSKSAIINVK